MLLRFTVVFTFLASVAAANPLTLADLEGVGFEFDEQQLFFMVGAIDGWSGKIDDERIEAYFYADAAFEFPALLENSTKEGNLSGWVDMCRVENVLMLSKGESACAMLDELTE